MESILPPETLEGSGYELTQVRQFTIFLENKVGRLQSLVRSLEQGVGKIVALSIKESGDAALVRLIAAHPSLARTAQDRRLRLSKTKRSRAPSTHGNSRWCDFSACCCGDKFLPYPLCGPRALLALY